MNERPPAPTAASTCPRISPLFVHGLETIGVPATLSERVDVTPLTAMFHYRGLYIWELPADFACGEGQ